MSKDNSTISDAVNELGQLITIIAHDSQESLDYEAIDNLMKKVSKDNGITPEELHDGWLESHGGKTPDHIAQAIRKRSTTNSLIDEALIVYDEVKDDLGHLAWVRVSKELTNRGHNRTMVQNAIVEAISKFK